MHTVPDTARQCHIRQNHLWVDCQPDQTADLNTYLNSTIKKENEELKRIIGIVTIRVREGKKEVISYRVPTKLIAGCMHINHKISITMLTGYLRIGDCQVPCFLNAESEVL